MSKNPRAKSLAAQFNLPYSAALGILRSESELAEELADHENTSIQSAMAKLAADYPMVKARADQDGASFRKTLDRVRDEQARQRRFSAAAASFPTVDHLLREAIQSFCNDVSGEQIEVEGQDDLHVPGLNFKEVDLPRDVVDEISVQAIDLDLDTLVWNCAEVYEGGTEVGTAEIRATVTLDGFMFKSDTYGNDEVGVLEFDWNDQKSYVGFDREVVLEFEATVQPGLSVDNIEFVAATDGQAHGLAA